MSRADDLIEPAYLWQKEIFKGMADLIGTIDCVYYFGGTTPEMPRLNDDSDNYAIVSPDGKCIGFFSYEVDPKVDAVTNISVVSFDRGNPLIGIVLADKLEEFMEYYRRIEWVMIGGNPMEKHYDSFCRKHNGEKHVLHDVVIDGEGEYHDWIIYEIMNRGVDAMD
jgi:hypothetical protein